MSATELPKLEELFIAGAQLSNCAFNLAQSDKLDDRVRKSLGECQKRWNAAFGERTSLRLALQANVDLAAESERLQDVLLRNGFVQCDIAACNCGSWHARFGYPERITEIKDALQEAGHPVCNDNGNLISKALAGLVGERDSLRAALEDIAEWRLPATGEFWDGDPNRPISYTSNYGSLGAEDFIRSVARAALKEAS